MKKVILLVSATMLTIATWAGEGKKYSADTQNSVINWTGEKVTGLHTGTLNLKEGVVEFNNGKPVSAFIKVDMNTMKSTDMQGEYADKLIGHLKSDDFFSVEKNPVVEFKATKFEAIKQTKQGAPNYKVTGDLTIKGITHPISFNAYINEGGDALLSNAEVVFDRTKWNIRYGSGSFFDDLGDKVIYDDIKLNFYLSAK